MATEASGNNGDLNVTSKLQVSSPSPQSSKSENDNNDNKASTTSATDDTIDSLRKELERLKLRLEEERKKLNDVSCECTELVYFLLFPIPIMSFYSFYSCQPFR